MKIMKNKYRLVIIILIFTSLVLISPFMSKVTVQSAEELKNVTFGFPLPFVSQDQSQYDPPFPYDASLASPWENPTTIDIGAFLLSVIIVNFLGAFVFRALDNR